MLKIRVVAIGKDKDRWISEGISHYRKLLARYANVDVVPIPDPKTSAALSPAEIKKKQAPLLEKELGKGAVIALSDRGRELDSVTFSKFIERLQVTGGGAVTFLIGGPYGIDDSLIARADHVISLSKLTFSHQVVRLVLLEQLYRAFSILAGTDYHK